MSNVDTARYFLKYWYDATQLRADGITFEQALTALQNSEPRRLYMDLYGGDFKYISASDAREALTSLGSNYPHDIPDPAAFDQVLIDRVNPKNITNFIRITKESVADSTAQITKTVASYGSLGLNSVFYIALAGFALWVFTKAKR